MTGILGGERLARAARSQEFGSYRMSEYDSELSKIVAELNRAAPSQQRAGPVRVPQSTASLDKLLQAAAARNASDVILIVGAPAMVRINGVLAAGGSGALEAEDLRSLVLPLLEPKMWIPP